MYKIGPMRRSFRLEVPPLYTRSLDSRVAPVTESGGGLSRASNILFKNAK